MHCPTNAKGGDGAMGITLVSILYLNVFDFPISKANLRLLS